MRGSVFAVIIDSISTVIFCFTAVAILSISSSDKDKCGITEDCSIALILTDKHLVRINPTKTDLVPLTRKATNFELNMGANSIEQTNETKHLGLMICFHHGMLFLYNLKFDGRFVLENIS
jgi:hypothetical protein